MIRVAVSKPVEGAAMIVLCAGCALYFVGALLADLADWISGRYEE